MIDIIQNRFAQYSISHSLDEKNALKEISQEIILFSLWRANFFEVAAFQGGTSLRILHGLSRFSEDINFILIKPDMGFIWQPYLDKLVETCTEFGMEPEAIDRNRMDKSIKSAILNDNSIANQLNLRFVDNQQRKSVKN